MIDRFISITDGFFEVAAVVGKQTDALNSGEYPPQEMHRYINLCDTHKRDMAEVLGFGQTLPQHVEALGEDPTPVLEFLNLVADYSAEFSSRLNPNYRRKLGEANTAWPGLKARLQRIGMQYRKLSEAQAKPSGEKRLTGAPEAAYESHREAMSLHPDLKGYKEVYDFIELNAHDEKFKQWGKDFPSTFEGFKRAMGTANKHYRTPVNKSPSDRPHGSSIADKNKL